MITGNAGPGGYRTLIVGNNREYFAPLDPYIPSESLPEFQRADIDESDPDLLWCGDDALVLLPEPLDSEFLEDISALMGFGNLRTVSPRRAGPNLCYEALAEDGLVDSIVALLSDQVSPQVIPWGDTEPYRELVAALRRRRPDLLTPEDSLTGSEWTAQFFGSKLGTRQILTRVAARVAGVEVPTGFICESEAEARPIASHFAQLWGGVVIKGNQGGSGLGVGILAPDRHGAGTRRQEVDHLFASNPLLCSGPLVVEEYVPPAWADPAAFPSVDSVVRPDGSVEVKCVDAMVLRKEAGGVGFYGCRFGKGLFTREQSEVLARFATEVGVELSSHGFRGWYDVDFILSESGRIVVTECNTRRTSMCYLSELGKSLAEGDCVSQGALVSNDRYINPSLHDWTYREVKRALSPILYPIGGRQRGIVITQSFRSMLGRGKFGYASIGEDIADAQAIESDLDQLLPAQT